MKNVFIRAAGWLCAAVACLALSATARAQDFYGEGNVLVAVDMGAFQVNDDAGYPEGTMGTLVWGADAPEGVSTRPAFHNSVYTVSPDVAPVAAPDYPIAAGYAVGDKRLFPYIRDDDADYTGKMTWFSEDAFPREVIERGFPIHKDYVRVDNGKTQYSFFDEYADGETHPCADFLEIECVAVTRYSTLWQYTGVAYSNRTGFDAADYRDAPCLSEEEIRYFTDTCDSSYEAQARLYGDPRWEDAHGDHDGKAAYVVLDLSLLKPNTDAYYWSLYTYRLGFDCLVIGSQRLPAHRADVARAEVEDVFTGTLIHELNHYIISGCVKDAARSWSQWLAEAFAQSAVAAVAPGKENYYKDSRSAVTNNSSRLRMLPGMYWDCGGDFSADVYPPFQLMPYALGAYFLQYVERETTGRADTRLWTQFFVRCAMQNGLTSSALDAYLREVTGENLDSWLARFLAQTVRASDLATAEEERVIPTDSILCLDTFLRPCEEYGQKLNGFEGVADKSVVENMTEKYGFFAVEGGGTTFAYRNDAGGRIAVTGADERWHFFALDLNLPAAQTIGISSAAELAKIGRDPRYPLDGRYVLTADVDLGGAEHPWSPIGTDLEPFFGEFDGGGHTVSGLYINNPMSDDQGLFSRLSGNAVIRDLNVRGSVRGNSGVGGLIGVNMGGTLSGCTVEAAVAGVENVGGVVGYHYAGTVEHCTVTGTVTGARNVGGVMGYISWAEVENCRAANAVSATELVAGGIAGYCEGGGFDACVFSGSVRSNIGVGGVAGFCKSYGRLKNCYQTGTVAGTDRVGGVVGVYQYGYDRTLENCYNAGTVSGETNVGGVVGRLAYAEMKNCYSWQNGLPAFGSIHVDDEGHETAEATACYALTENGGADTLTAAGFRAQSSFEGWDFENVWDLANGVRPVLRNNREAVASHSDGSGRDSSARHAANADSSAVNTVTGADGSTAVVKTGGNGALISAEVSLGAGAAEAAKGGAVRLPLTVRAANRENAAEIRITLPAGKKRARVEIPVENLTAGTLAVIVRPDGTEEIVKTSSTSADGVVLTLDGPATVKIVDNTRPMSDVKGDEWYADSVAWAVSHEVMNGVGDGAFAPNAAASRGQITQLLMNLDGAQAPADFVEFLDVHANDWFAGSVAWAVKTGVAHGRGESFGANDPVSREDLALMLYNYARHKGYDVSASGSITGFPDADSVDDYARQALSWAIGVGLINGTTDENGSVLLDPHGASTRGMVAAIMQRFCETVAK